MEFVVFCSRAYIKRLIMRAYVWVCVSECFYCVCARLLCKLFIVWMKCKFLIDLKKKNALKSNPTRTETRSHVSSRDFCRQLAVAIFRNFPPRANGGRGSNSNSNCDCTETVDIHAQIGFTNELALANGWLWRWRSPAVCHFWHFCYRTPHPPCEQQKKSPEKMQKKSEKKGERPGTRSFRACYLWLRLSPHTMGQQRSGESVCPKQTQWKTAWQRFQAGNKTKRTRVPFSRNFRRPGRSSGAPIFRAQFGNFPGVKGRASESQKQHKDMPKEALRIFNSCHCIHTKQSEGVFGFSGWSQKTAGGGGTLPVKIIWLMPIPFTSHNK